MPIETTAAYRQRRVKDRVTAAYVLSVAERAGYPIGDDAFWRTDEKSICFTEKPRRGS